MQPKGELLLFKYRWTDATHWGKKFIFNLADVRWIKGISISGGSLTWSLRLLPSQVLKNFLRTSGLSMKLDDMHLFLTFGAD
jgi:hypothetical protein